MSESAVDVTHTTETETSKVESDTGATDEVAKWKAMARKHEQAAKVNAEAAKRLEQIEADKAKADQTAAEREAAAEQRANAADLKALRLEVAFDKGLTPAQAKRLVGATKDELEADADDILEHFPVKKDDGRPKGNADQGVRTTPPPSSPRQADLQQIEADLQSGRKK